MPISDRHDRRHIAPLLAPHFPDMAAMGSDEIHHFLNALTGHEVAPEAENAAAFDAWRQALAGMGYEGVWSTTPRQEAEIRDRVAERVEAAMKWRAAQEARTAGELTRLAKLDKPLLPVAAP
ncbi:MAG: hypothetical protein U1E53_13080 [Dongiaceae bacterium]